VTTPLIDAEELRARLGDPGLRVCDVRWYLADPGQGAREYSEGHIPGARFVDLETVLSGARGPGRHPLPDPVRFAASLGRLGIAIDDAVVAYDSTGGATAARLWWMLRALGHDDVRVLDGGLAAWGAAGGELTDRVPEIAPTPYPVLMSSWPGAVSIHTVRDELGRTTLVDARAAERFEGRYEPIDPRAGHIPGAVSRPHTGNLGPDGRHLPPDRLLDRYADVGDEPIVYCGSGVTACADLLAMEVAGITDGRLYEGSWSDWSSHDELPIEGG
jgi:thiosulfate/3-mercaptopyruvate sulfurtransferase